MLQAAYGLQPGTLELGQAGVQKLEVVETLGACVLSFISNRRPINAY